MGTRASGLGGKRQQRGPLATAPWWLCLLVQGSDQPHLPSVNTHTHTPPHTQKHTRVHTHTRVNTHTHMYRHVYTRTSVHLYTHTSTNTHTQPHRMRVAPGEGLLSPSDTLLAFRAPAVLEWSVRLSVFCIFGLGSWVLFVYVHLDGRCGI